MADLEDELAAHRRRAIACILRHPEGAVVQLMDELMEFMAASMSYRKFFEGDLRIRCGLYASFADAIEKRLDDLRKASVPGADE